MATFEDRPLCAAWIPGCCHDCHVNDMLDIVCDFPHRPQAALSSDLCIKTRARPEGGEKGVDALDDHGWMDEDTDSLEALINLLDGGDSEHEAAKDRKKGFTKGRNLAADGLYKMCRSVQNAARLAYPAAKADRDETILVARNRFLLDEFPPRDRGKEEDSTPAPAPPIA